jgi:hypothetical protein
MTYYKGLVITSGIRHFQYFNAGGDLIKVILSLRVRFMGLLHFGGLVVVYWAAVVECSFR